MPLRVYNSLTRQREDFAPLNPPRVGMYVCGPTVYAHSHLGHAKSYVSFDVMLRWLRASGYEVAYVQNITDVGHMTGNDEDAGEDPIIREARRRGLHPMAVVETFMRSYFEDMDALNVLRADIAPRATGHIPEQIEMARRLIELGHAYVANGSVYFDVSSFPGYGKLSGRAQEELEAGARVALNPEKRNPADFALWKRADADHIMRWPSPWGEGFPGWHLECSAMSQKYLGQTIDIHGGGMENKFPHHECEIAQSECASGKPFVRYWLHNNMVTINGQKMGKSLGNSVSLKDILGTQEPLRDRSGALLLERSFAPAVVRHFILTSHYGATLDFSNEALKAAESGSLRLRDALREIRNAARQAPPAGAQHGAGVARQPGVDEALRTLDADFAAAMNEDFNTAAAIAALFAFIRKAQDWPAAGVGREAYVAAETTLNRLTGDVLGLRWADEPRHDAARENALIQLLVDLRQDAKAGKNYALADHIRARLATVGVELRDTPAGVVW